MAVRANFDLKNSIIKTYRVKSGTTTVAGKRVKFGTADDEVDNAAAGDDLAFGTARAAVVGDGSKTVEVILDCHQLVPMLVGTGGCTRGVRQKYVSDGITDATTNGGGTTAEAIVGIAMQTGVAGDVVGVCPLPYARAHA